MCPHFKLLRLQHYLQARQVHINADMMSRLVLATSMDVSVTGDTVILLETLQSSPMTASSLKPETQHCQGFKTMSIKTGFTVMIPSYDPIRVLTWTFLYK